MPIEIMMLLAFIFMIFCLTMISLTAIGNRTIVVKILEVFGKLFDMLPKFFIQAQKFDEDNKLSNKLQSFNKDHKTSKSLQCSDKDNDLSNQLQNFD